MVIPLPNLQLISKNEMQKLVKPSKNETKKGFFLNKRIDKGFDPKAYKLLAKMGYDFTSSSQLGELSLETTCEKIHALNETQKKLKQQRYTIKPSKVGIGFVSSNPIKILAKTKKTKANT